MYGMYSYLYVLLRDFVYRIFCSIPLFYKISFSFKKFCDQCYPVERTKQPESSNLINNLLNHNLFVNCNTKEPKELIHG